MRQALVTAVATAVFVLYSQGVFAQATAPAQPDPATSSPPASAATSPAPSPGATPPSPTPAPQEPTVSAPPPPPTKQISVSALTEKDLESPKENEVGDIERVVEANSDKKQYLVISRGGFLGLFESEVLVPLENVAAQGDRIVLRNVTEEQIKAYPKFDNDDKAYRELEGSTTISLTEMK
jgi:sporulation protein YlmC with PRC-barrel domain